MNDDDNPFIDEMEESEQMCWRDGSRMCGQDCVAYDEKCEDDSRWLPCTLLNIKRAKAKSFSLLAQELRKLNDTMDQNSRFVAPSEEDVKEALNRMRAEESAQKRQEAEAYAQKIKEMDPGPPEIK